MFPSQHLFSLLPNVFLHSITESNVVQQFPQVSIWDTANKVSTFQFWMLLAVLNKSELLTTGLQSSLACNSEHIFYGASFFLYHDIYFWINTHRELVINPRSELLEDIQIVYRRCTFLNYSQTFMLNYSPREKYSFIQEYLLFLDLCILFIHPRIPVLRFMLSNMLKYEKRNGPLIFMVKLRVMWIWLQVMYMNTIHWKWFKINLNKWMYWRELCLKSFILC